MRWASAVSEKQSQEVGFQQQPLTERRWEGQRPKRGRVWLERGHQWAPASISKQVKKKLIHYLPIVTNCRIAFPTSQTDREVSAAQATGFSLPFLFAVLCPAEGVGLGTVISGDSANSTPCDHIPSLCVCVCVCVCMRERVCVCVYVFLCTLQKKTTRCQSNIVSSFPNYSEL